MMLKRFLILWIFVICFCHTEAAGQKPNTLTKTEKKEGWRLLFDGKSFLGWQQLANDGWEIKNGELIATGTSDGKQRDIITTEQFSNMELIFEFRIFNLTNSGVKYLVTNSFPGQKNTYLGLEYQILDDVNYKYPERGYLRSLASLYDLIPAKKNTTVSFGKWNVAKIVVIGNHIEHWLNNEKVVDYDRGSESFQNLIKDSKYKNLENFGKAIKGFILLQNEGTPVSFRNIKIKIL